MPTHAARTTPSLSTSVDFHPPAPAEENATLAHVSLSHSSSPGDRHRAAGSLAAAPLPLFFVLMRLSSSRLPRCSLAGLARSLFIVTPSRSPSLLMRGPNFLWILDRKEKSICVDRQ